MNSMKKHIPFFVRHKQNILFESYWNYYTIETTDLLLEKKMKNHASIILLFAIFLNLFEFLYLFIAI